MMWITVWTAGMASADPPRGPDLDRDGYEDLVIGHPFEEVNGYDAAGAVAFLYGSASGPVHPVDRTTGLWQDVPGVEGAGATSEGFGEAVAWGDFDGDCYDDVIVGAPGSIVDGVDEAGVVQLFYGSATGPSTAGDVILHRNSPNVDGSANSHSWFGQTLAVGDFDGDDYDDAAIGTPGDTVNGLYGAGTVTVVYGSTSGLSATVHRADQLWQIGAAGVDGAPALIAWFGQSLATGDFDCDGYEDLAVGVGVEVRVLYGSAAGLSASATRADQTWSQDAAGVQGSIADSGDEFGSDGSDFWLMQPLIAGNFDGNVYQRRACDDLAIGVHRETVGPVSHAGGVQILYGASGTGLQASNPDDDLWTEASQGVDGSPDTDDDFGSMLTVGRFDGDGYDDLAISSREANHVGEVHVLHGSTTGIDSAGDALWDRGDVGTPAATGDAFGHATSASDFDGDGVTSLVVGIPYADLPWATGTGFVVVIEPNGASVGSYTSWMEEEVTNLVSEDNDQFGSAFAPPRTKPLACTPILVAPGGGLSP